MKKFVVCSVLSVAALAASDSFAARQISCRGGEVTIHVQIDVLESNPPQSSISVKRNGQDWGSYSAFTEYLELESFPVQYQWRFPDHDGNKTLIVTTKQPASRGPRAANGTYIYNRATSPIPLKCSVQ